MDSALHTPLLDFFRRVEVARDIRLLAAQGAIAPRPLEQLCLLMVLSTDPDQGIRETTEATLAKIPPALVSGFIARNDVPTDLREFFVRRGIPVATSATPEPEVPFVDGDDTDYGPDEPNDLEKNEPDRNSIYHRIAGMTIPQKVKAAMKGTREMRGVLIRDSNKLVALSVLSSPKVTDNEVEAYARMGSVAEDVLRGIARTRRWMKNYGVVLALVKNAKTPVAVSLNLMARLNEGDLKRLSTDRNVPEPLRIAARKRVVLG